MYSINVNLKVKHECFHFFTTVIEGLSLINSHMGEMRMKDLVLLDFRGCSVVEMLCFVEFCFQSVRIFKGKNGTKTSRKK